MYNAKHVANHLKSLIGWSQEHSTPKIYEYLTQSESNRYYQDFHPLLSLDLLRQVAPKETILPPLSEWQDCIAYPPGVKIAKKGHYYVSRNSTFGKPPEDYSIWDVYDPFSEWLEAKTNAGIMQAIANLWNNKIQKGSMKNVLEKREILTGAGRISNIIPNEGNLVGFEIIPLRTPGVVLKIDAIGFQFNNYIEKLRLYVLHSSSYPYQVVELKFNPNHATGMMEWLEMEDLYFYTGVAGGSWFIVYDQTELGDDIQAIQYDRDWSKKPCTCNPISYEGWRLWSQYCEFHPMKVKKEGDSTQSVIWDLQKNLYTYQTNYGLNFKVTLECNASEFIIDNKMNFVDLIGLQVAHNLIEELKYNPHNNITQKLSNSSIESTSKDIRERLEQAYEVTSLDMSNYSSVCMPCGKRGVRWMTI